MYKTIILIVSIGYLFGQTPTWSKRVISTGIVGVKQNAMVNLDADLNRNMDIVVTANPEGNGAEDLTKVNVLWFKNDGAQNFTQFNIDMANIGARGLAVGDLTGNGYPDVIVGSRTTDSSLVWYLNDGTPDIGSWPKNHIGKAAPNNYIIKVYDLNQDGKLDIVDGMGDDANYGSIGGGFVIDSLRWFQNLGGLGTAVFTPKLIAQYSSPSGIALGDFNNDGLTDVISGSFLDYNNLTPVVNEDIRWWSQGSGSSWTQQQIIQQTYGTNDLAVKDLDKNGTLDIIGAGYKSQTIDWWSNNGLGVFSSINTITTNFTHSRNVDVVDVDGDGDWDIVAAADNDNKISWFENDGSQIFTEHIVDNTFTYAYFVTATDLDGDGDIDFIGTAQNANELSWWENDLAEEQVIAAGDPAPAFYQSGKVIVDFGAGFSGGNTSVFYNHGEVANRAAVTGGLDHVALNGYYTIRTAATSYTATIDFTFSGISEWSAVNNKADLRICVWDDALSQWKIAGTSAQTIDQGNNVITVPGLTTELAKYSLFTLGSVSVDNSLPVELSAFSGSVVSGGIELSWKTESETNNRGFELWRKSADGDDFKQLSSFDENDDLLGLGTASYGQEYVYFDTDLQPGTRYIYKLVDVNYDGSRFEHSSIKVDYVDKGLIKVVDNQVPRTMQLAQNYPNPFNGSTRINFSIPLDKTGRVVSLAIYNQSGQKVKSLYSGPLSNGNYAFIWNGQNQTGGHVASGMYLYVLQSGATRMVKRMTYLK